MQVYLGVKEASYPDGTKLNDVMKWNEYGTATIPPRPVLRIAAEKIVESDKFQKVMSAYLQNLLVNPSEAAKLETELLRKLGSRSAAKAKRIIKGGGELQENAPATIRKKGAGKPPLYDTGLMVKNISYEIGE